MNVSSICTVHFITTKPRWVFSEQAVWKAWASLQKSLFPKLVFKLREKWTISCSHGPYSREWGKILRKRKHSENNPNFLLIKQARPAQDVNMPLEYCVCDAHDWPLLTQQQKLTEQHAIGIHNWNPVMTCITRSGNVKSSLQLMAEDRFFNSKIPYQPEENFKWLNRTAEPTFTKRISKGNFTSLYRTLSIFRYSSAQYKLKYMEHFRISYPRKYFSWSLYWLKSNHCIF